MLVWLGAILGLSLLFWMTLAIAFILWSRQTYLLSQYNPAPQVYGQIFRQNVLLGFVLLVGMIFGSLL